MPNNWQAYLLQCGDGSYYCGCTNDLERRLRQHASGRGAKYVRGRGPLTVVAVSPMMSKSQALRREAAVKKLPRDKKPAAVETDT